MKPFSNIVAISALAAALQPSFATPESLESKRKNILPTYQNAKQKAARDTYVNLIVELTPDRGGKTYHSAKRAIKRLGVQLGKQIGQRPWYKVSLTEAQLEALLDSGAVKVAQESLKLKVDLVDTIPHIEADAAQALGFEGLDYSIVVVDTGVDRNSIALQGKVVSEACFSTNSGGLSSLCPNGAESQLGNGAAAPCDDSDPDLGQWCAHGTQVASIATSYAFSLNGSRDLYQGVAPAADIIAINVSSLDSTGSPTIDLTNVVDALDYTIQLAASHDIAAVNLSLGGALIEGYCDAQLPFLKTVVDDLKSIGIATVAASGNYEAGESQQRLRAGWPGCITSAINTGSSGRTDDIIPAYSKESIAVDLLAPGTDVRSVALHNTSYPTTGTSMSAPHVSGAIAVIKSAYPHATVDQIEHVLKTTGVAIRDRRNGLTLPRINVFDAVSLPITPQAGVTSATYRMPRQGNVNVQLFEHEQTEPWYSHNFDRYGNSNLIRWSAPSGLSVQFEYRVDFGKQTINQDDDDIGWTEFKTYSPSTNQGWLSVLPGQVYNMFYAREFRLPESRYNASNPSNDYINIHYRLRTLNSSGNASDWKYLKPIWLYYPD